MTVKAIFRSDVFSLCRDDMGGQCTDVRCVSEDIFDKCVTPFITHGQNNRQALIFFRSH